MSSEAEGGQIHLNIETILWSYKIKLTQEDDWLEWKYYAGSMPLLTPIPHFQDMWRSQGLNAYHNL